MLDAKIILNKVLEYTGKTKNSLAKTIGLRRSQNLYDIDSGKVKNISSELSEKITKSYPKINRDWLLTGDGEMLIGQTEKEDKLSDTAARFLKLIEQHADTINKQQDMLRDQYEKLFAKEAPDITEAPKNGEPLKKLKPVK